MFISYNKTMHNLNYAKEIRSNGDGTVNILQFNDKIITIPISYQQITIGMINDTQLLVADENPVTERSSK